MKITYRQLDASEPENKQLLKVMQKACLPADSLYFPEDGVWWVAYRKDTLVGFSCLSPSQQMEDGIYLGRCGVLKAYRGYGIQRQMIRLRVQWARRHEYRWAVSDTTDNIPSANNLISCGFRLYTPKIAYSFARSLYWRKRL